jgi:hypothetical protein
LGTVDDPLRLVFNTSNSKFKEPRKKHPVLSRRGVPAQSILPEKHEKLIQVRPGERLKLMSYTSGQRLGEVTMYGLQALLETISRTIAPCKPFRNHTIPAGACPRPYDPRTKWRLWRRVFCIQHEPSKIGKSHWACANDISLAMFWLRLSRAIVRLPRDLAVRPLRSSATLPHWSHEQLP